jgi:hypothetical protein
LSAITEAHGTLQKLCNPRVFTHKNKRVSPENVRGFLHSEPQDQMRSVLGARKRKKIKLLSGIALATLLIGCGDETVTNSDQ